MNNAKNCQFYGTSWWLLFVATAFSLSLSLRSRFIRHFICFVWPLTLCSLIVEYLDVSLQNCVFLCVVFAYMRFFRFSFLLLPLSAAEFVGWWMCLQFYSILFVLGSVFTFTLIVTVSLFFTSPAIMPVISTHSLCIHLPLVFYFLSPSLAEPFLFASPMVLQSQNALEAMRNKIESIDLITFQ